MDQDVSEVEDEAMGMMDRLQDSADYSVHESYQVETLDHEDHTFCGIMFDVAVKGVLPIEYVEISAVWVRGALGEMSVYVTEGGYEGKLNHAAMWKRVFHGRKEPSPNCLVPLELQQRIRILPDTKVGIYVHSTRRDDEAIVYDNQRHDYSHEDRFIQVSSGCAHISHIPFDPRGPWGYAWRPHREFVGKISHGVRFLLWKPQKHIHTSFPRAYRQAVRTLLLCASRPGAGLNRCPGDIPYIILQFCPWHWFGSLSSEEDTLTKTAQDLLAEETNVGIDWHGSAQPRSSYYHRVLRHQERNFPDNVDQRGQGLEDDDEEDDPDWEEDEDEDEQEELDTEGEGEVDEEEDENGNDHDGEKQMTVDEEGEQGQDGGRDSAQEVGSKSKRDGWTKQSVDDQSKCSTSG